MTDERTSPRPAPDVIEPGVPATDEVRDEQLRTGDISEGPAAPADDAQSVEDWGTTKAEERQREPLAMRLAREEPERGPATGSTEAAGRVLQDDSNVGGVLDVEADEVGELDVGDGDTLSAEESAMQVRDSAPGGSRDADPGYVDHDRPERGARP